MRTRRFFATILGSLVLTSAAVALAMPAQAASTELDISPATGNDRTVISLTTDGPCTRGTNVIARLYGNGFAADGQIVIGNSPTSAYQKTTVGGYVLPLTMTMRDFMNLQDEPTALSGSYRFEVDCRDNVKPASLQVFKGSLTFTNAHDYKGTAVSFKPTPLPKGDPLGDGASDALLSASPSPNPLATGAAPQSTANPRSTDAPQAAGTSSGSGGSSNSGLVVILLIVVVVLAGALGFKTMQSKGSATS